jgi:putative protease
LESLASRGYTEGFYSRHLPKEYQNYESGFSVSIQQQFVGEIIDRDIATGEWIVDVKNRFSMGDQIELMSPSGNQTFTLSSLRSLAGTVLDVAPGSGHTVRITVPDNAHPEYGLLMKSLQPKQASHAA